MANVRDVAAYILSKAGPMSTMKLQKLVYYAQAWSLVWDEDRLFPERIEAWANGPVCPDLYNAHKGLYRVSSGDIVGNPTAFTSEQTETIDAVLAFYGTKEPQWLSDLTHNEEPWRKARRGVPAGDRSNNEITLTSMQNYYASL